MTYLLGRDDPVPRLRPTTSAGVTALVAVGAAVVAAQYASGVPLRARDASQAVLVPTELIPALVAAVMLLAFVGWTQWDAVWRDPYRLPVRRPALVVVGLVSLAVAWRAVAADWNVGSASLLGVIVAAAALTGLAEELALRGVLLRSLRVRRRPELAAALWTTAASALVQLPVLLLAGTRPSAVAVLVALTLGALFYLVRRATRSLAAAVALHAIWDVGTLLDRASADIAPGAVETTASWVLALLVLLALAVTLRGDRSRRALVDPRLDAQRLDL